MLIPCVIYNMGGISFTMKKEKYNMNYKKNRNPAQSELLETLTKENHFF